MMFQRFGVSMVPCTVNPKLINPVGFRKFGFRIDQFDIASPSTDMERHIPRFQLDIYSGAPFKLMLSSRVECLWGIETLSADWCLFCPKLLTFRSIPSIPICMLESWPLNYRLLFPKNKPYARSKAVTCLKQDQGPNHKRDPAVALLTLKP